MQEQNYANHAMFVPMFHFVLFGIIALSLIGSFVNLWQSLGDHEKRLQFLQRATGIRELI